MRYNRERAVEYLAKYDLEALIVSGTTSVSYFSGMDSWMYTDFRENLLNPGGSNAMLQSYVILTPDRPANIVLGSGTINYMTDADPVEIRPYGEVATKLPVGKRGEPEMWSRYRRAIARSCETPQEALVSALQDLGVKKGRVGVELYNLSKAAKKHLAKKMGRLDLLDASELVRFIRMVKTEEEHARLKKAAEITERGITKSLQEAGDGVRWGKLKQAYLSVVAGQGAVPDHYTFSPAGFGVSEDPEYVLRKGFATQLDCGAHYKLYSSDTGVGLILGNGRKDAEKMYQSLWEIFDSCLDTLAPGATPSYILKRFKRAYKKHEVDGVSYQGHSIGLQAREYPIITYTKNKRIADDVVDVSTDIPLEEGMVINIETGLHLLGNSSYQVERSFRIGKSKAVEITPKRDGPAVVVAG